MKQLDFDLTENEKNLPIKKFAKDFGQLKIEIQKRIEKKFYESDFVKDKVIERLIDDLLNRSQG